MSEHLISVEDLASRLGDPGVRIADVRWYLEDPTRGRREYDAGHIPGAIYIDVARHLSSRGGPGRHPLPPPSVLAATLARHGIGDDHLVVAYDDRGGAIAARLWWMLREIGHSAVRVLDGGLAAWTGAGHPLDTDEPALLPADLTVHPPLTRAIERASVLSRLGSIVLLDARAPERYRGDDEPIDPIAGHIPTAHSAPYEENLGPDGRFRSPGDLAARYRALGADSDRVVAYCGSGVTACHTILACVVAGLPEPMLYPGSWSDWSTSEMPVATGPEPGPAPIETGHRHGSTNGHIVQIADYELTAGIDDFIAAIGAVSARVEAEGVSTMTRYTFYFDREARTVTSVILHCCAESWLRHHEMLDRWSAEFKALKQTFHQTRLRLFGPVSPAMRAWLTERGVAFEAIEELAAGFVRSER